LLQTVVEVAAEKNSTLVMPVPVELLRFFDRAARPAAGQAPAAAAATPAIPAADTPAIPAADTPAIPATNTPATSATGTLARNTGAPDTGALPPARDVPAISAPGRQPASAGLTAPDHAVRKTSAS
jgi:hypothetical protein